MPATTMTPLRLAGFLATVAGALAVGVGASLTWITAGIGSDSAGQLTSPIHGLDLFDGKVVLGLALFALIAILAVRTATHRARRILAALILVAGLASAVLGIYDVATAENRFESVSVSRLAEEAQRLGVPEGRAHEQVARAAQDLGAFTDVELGLWLTLAGGLILAVGGVLTLVWAGVEGTSSLSSAVAEESAAAGPAST